MVAFLCSSRVYVLVEECLNMSLDVRCVIVRGFWKFRFSLAKLNREGEACCLLSSCNI